jgi:hypothetical protein
MRTISALVVLGFLQSVDVVPSRDLNPWKQQVEALQRQAVERDNELLHLRAQLATCHATVDSLDLTSQASEMVRRFESTFGGAWIWDNTTQRVVKVTKEKSQ